LALIRSILIDSGRAADVRKLILQIIFALPSHCTERTRAMLSPAIFPEIFCAAGIRNDFSVRSKTLITSGDFARFDFADETSLYLQTTAPRSGIFARRAARNSNRARHLCTALHAVSVFFIAL
jgi:hypothetical protein